MSEIQTLRSQSIVNRGIYQFKQVQERKKSDALQETNVKILGYDSTTGHFQIIDATGKISNARTITNSGALEIGSQLEMVSPLGGIPIIDGMPR